MKRNRTALAVASLAVVFSVAACGHGNATNRAQVIEQKQQGIDSYNLDVNQPVPGFNRSVIRQELIDIQTAEANGEQSTTFFMNFSDHPEGSCPSLGAPVPTTDQLTNPVQVQKDNVAPIWNGGGNVGIGQEDPIGVYTGDSSGTWVMCVDTNDGKVVPQYWEGNVRVVMGPAVWDSATNGPKLTGEPSSLFQNLKH